MNEAQLKALLVLSRWDQLTLAEQEEAALAVAVRLPESFHLTGLEAHELGQQRHRVAFFTWQEARFALIPGGSATLGYDPDQPFIPTQADLSSWQETFREYLETAPEALTFERYLTDRLTPLRQVTVAPFLLEVEATDLTPWVLDPARGGYRSSFASRPQTQERLAQEGFRFPTPDEWEYACAAGARTLWRWGNACPLIPLDTRVLRTRATPLSWDLHRRPNAFGLRIGDDAYCVEFTAEPTVLCGGDGGTALHSGAGHFVQWLTLASSYRGVRMRVPKPEVPMAHLRRAYSLFA